VLRGSTFPIECGVSTAERMHTSSSPSRRTNSEVILRDMMMPGMNGVEFHRWLGAHHPALARRVVFVTGGAFTPMASDYLEQVENLRVEKPFDSTNLPKLVGELVRAAKVERRPRR
jgi:FixJ family two-component response regulator